MQKIKFILHYMDKYKWLMLGVFIVTIIFAAFNLLSSILFSFVIDNVIDQKVINNPIITIIADALGGTQFIRNNLWIMAILLIFINLIVAVCVYLRGKWQAIVSENTIKNLRNNLYSHLQLLPFSTYSKLKTGDLIQRCTSDVDIIRRLLAGQLSEMVNAIFTPLIAVLVLFSIYPPLAKLAIISMPILVLYAYFFFTKMQKAFKDSDESEAVMTSIIQESLSGIRVTKAFSRAEYEIKRFDKKNKEFKNLTFRMIKLLGMYWSTSDFICLIQIFVILIFGIQYARNGLISVGDFFVFISYESMILWPIRNLGRIISDLGKMSISIDRLKEIFDYPIEDIESGNTYPINGNIKFEHVSFRYEKNSPMILNDVSFEIKEGETVAIIGPTGSGKSSLVHLLCRLYDVSEGNLYLDGHNINEYQRKYLRSNIGIVLQEPFLYSKSIYENIHLSNPSLDENHVVEACKIASVHDVITEFDKGYNTLVGEKGVTLSGGQKQRIAIARTIINDNAILIFDDSLSAVDTETDNNIRKALKDIKQNTTTIIITQRISSAKDADKIIVLEDGTITNIGTHQELINKDGLYKRVYEIQNNLIEGGGIND